MDNRLQGRNAEKIADFFGIKPGQFEGLTYADPSLWITNPHRWWHRLTFWWLLWRVSVKAHHVKGVVLTGHSGCGGCKIKRGNLDPATEKRLIIADLRRSATKIKRHYPHLEVRIGFVTIHDDKPTLGAEELPEITIEEIPLAA
ncbi:MAG: hypothetical protein JW816_02650 [Candidatus Buchananbacteria bacterium]|nr:hypothetical protein [Candidatus Buchananbacteria bacterium]